MIVIVAGMHRSGTSALAGLLHTNGIIMGESQTWKPKRNKENPKGFFENKLFRMANDKLLAEYGYKVKSFDPKVPVVTNASSDVWDQMVGLINSYSIRYTTWGWKDPRTCLTIGVWLGVLRSQEIANQVKILIPCRPTRNIATSMLLRGNKGTGEQFEALARNYNKQLMRGCANYDFLTVDFDDLISRTEIVVAGISRYLGYTLTDISFIDGNLANRVA
jgi:hypothetical protein